MTDCASAFKRFSERCSIAINGEIVTNNSFVKDFVRHLESVLSVNETCRLLSVHPANDILHVISLVYLAIRGLCSYEPSDLTSDDLVIGDYYVDQVDPNNTLRFLKFDQDGAACFKSISGQKKVHPDNPCWSGWNAIEGAGGGFSVIIKAGRRLSDSQKKVFSGIVPYAEVDRHVAKELRLLKAFYADIFGIDDFTLSGCYHVAIAAMASEEVTKWINESVCVKYNDQMLPFRLLFHPKRIGIVDDDNADDEENDFTRGTLVYFVAGAASLHEFILSPSSLLPDKRMIIANVGSDLTDSNVITYKQAFYDQCCQVSCLLSDGSGYKVSELLDGHEETKVFAPEIKRIEVVVKKKRKKNNWNSLLSATARKIDLLVNHTVESLCCRPESDFVAANEYDSWPRFGCPAWNGIQDSPFHCARSQYYGIKNFLESCFYPLKLLEEEWVRDELGNRVNSFGERIKRFKKSCEELPSEQMSLFAGLDQILKRTYETLRDSNPKREMLCEILKKNSRSKKILIVVQDGFSKSFIVRLGLASIIRNQSRDLKVVTLDNLKDRMPEEPYDIAVYMSAKLAAGMVTGALSPYVAHKSIVLLYPHERIGYDYDRRARLQGENLIRERAGRGNAIEPIEDENDFLQRLREYRLELEAEQESMIRQYAIRDYASQVGNRERLVEVTSVVILGEGLRANLSRFYSALVYDPVADEVYSTNKDSPVRTGCLIAFLKNDDETHDVLDVMYQTHVDKLPENEKQGWIETQKIVRSWKKALCEYHMSNYGDSDRNAAAVAKQLREAGARVVDQTVRGWLDEDGDTICPTSLVSLQAIGRITGDERLINGASGILAKRRIFISRRNMLRDELKKLIKQRIGAGAPQNTDSPLAPDDLEGRIMSLIQIRKVEAVISGQWQMPYRNVNRIVLED